MATVFLRRCVRFGFSTLCVSAHLTLSGCGISQSLSSEVDNGAAAGESSVILSVKSVERRSIGQSITALGRCEAVPQKQALITPVIGGQVATILAQLGDAVTSGQPIVQLDTTLAQADLAEKQAARDSLIATMRSLESLPRIEERRTAELAIEQADIAVGRAQALVERLQPLRARNEVPEAQVFEAEEALKQAQVQKQTAQAQFDLLMLRPRKEVLAEAQSKIKMADEAVATSQVRLNLHTIGTPISGVLDRLTCRPGQTIAIGAPIGEIIDSQQVLAVVWLPVNRRRMIHVGQIARISANAISSAATEEADSTQTLDGKVVYVGQSADAQTGNVPLHISVDNRRGELTIGQPLYVNIVVEEPSHKLCVPLDAIHDEGEGAAVTVVRDGKTVVLYPKLGARASGWIAVSDTDLKVGESVAVAGAYNLPDGTLVSVESENSASSSKP